MTNTTLRATLSGCLALVLCACVAGVAHAEESDPIMGTSGSTKMTLEVLDQPDYGLVAQSEPKGDTALVDAAPLSGDEPTYPDMPQTGGSAGLALVTCAGALGVFLVGLEGWR